MRLNLYKVDGELVSIVFTVGIIEVLESNVRKYSDQERPADLK